MAHVIRHVTVTGQVQGVGYRAWAAETAAAFRLAGWVRNRRDGSVEALVAGAADDVEAFLAACRKGPRAAVVADVASVPGDGPVPAGFGVRPTA
jgi:acylphosphatase